MDYQFINITTFRGVSSEAEHFYATIGEPKHAQENLLTMAGASPETGVMFVNGKNLLYMPSYDEAKDIYLKDHYNVRNRDLNASDEDFIMEMVEDGTPRFPSILAVVEAARKKFPESVLCFCMSESSNEFRKWIIRNEKSEQVKKILDLLVL